MIPTLETDRRQHSRDGILEELGDITYAVLRKYEITSPASSVNPSQSSAMSANT